MAVQEKVSPPRYDAPAKFYREYSGQPEKFYEAMGARRHEGILSNGMRVVLFERPAPPRSSITLVTQGGARYDPPEIEGRAHLQEHVICSGSRQYPKPGMMHAILEPQASFPNAYTGHDYLGVESTFNDPDDLRQNLDAISGCITEPVYDPITIGDQKRVVIEEMKAKKANPERYLPVAIYKCFFAGTPLEKSILGTPETVRRISVEDMKTHGNEWFVGNRMALVAAGKLPFDELMDIAGEQLGHLPTGEKLEKSGPLSEKRENNGILIAPYTGSDKVFFALGFRTPPAYHPDNASLTLLQTVLKLNGGNFALLTKLRHDPGTGLVYDASAFNFLHNDAGIFGIYASTAKENLQKVLDLSTGLLKNIRDNGLPDEELAKIQNLYTKLNLGGVESPDAWVSNHIQHELDAAQNRPELNRIQLRYPMYENLRRITQLSRNETNRVIRNIFREGKWYLAMCGDVTREDFKVNF